MTVLPCIQIESKAIHEPNVKAVFPCSVPLDLKK